MTDLDARLRYRLQLVRKDMSDHYDEIDDCVSPLFNDAGELGAAVLAVIELHTPKSHPLAPEDRSCVGRGTHVTRTDWPCATVRAVAEAFGIEVEPPRVAPGA